MTEFVKSRTGPRRKRFSKRMVDRERKIIDFINDFTDKNHVSPTIREIGYEIGVNSTSLVCYYLDDLVGKGILGRNPNMSRSVWVKEQKQ